MASPVFSLSGVQQVVDRAEEPTRVMLRHASGETLYTMAVGAKDADPVPAYADVVGKLSKAYRRVEQAQADRMLRRRQTSLTAEGLAEAEIERLSACVVGWNLTDNGAELPCTSQNVRAVMSTAPWIKEEIAQAVGDTARFLD